MTDGTTPSPPPSEDQPDVAQSTARAVKGSEDATKARKHRVELVGAIIIGIAAVLTAIATHQGSQVDGIVEEQNTLAISLSQEANGVYNDVNAARGIERDWFFSWLSAELEGDTFAADVLFDAMPVDVQVLSAEWLGANQTYFTNPTAETIGDPFSEEYESYEGLLSSQLALIADDTFLQAQCALFETKVAGVQGDNYGLSTVALAIALVVGGIAALLRGKAAQMIVIVTAGLALVVGAGFLALANDEIDATAKATAEFFLNDDGTEIATDELGDPIDVPAALAIAAARCPESEFAG